MYVDSSFKVIVRFQGLRHRVPHGQEHRSPPRPLGQVRGLALLRVCRQKAAARVGPQKQGGKKAAAVAGAAGAGPAAARTCRRSARPLQAALPAAAEEDLAFAAEVVAGSPELESVELGSLDRAEERRLAQSQSE